MLTGRAIAAMGTLVGIGPCGAGTARATEEAFIEAAQPLHDPDASTLAFRVTSITSIGSPIPGLEIARTCDPNPIPIPRVSAARPETQPRNSNAANPLGLTVTVQDRSDSCIRKRRRGRGRTNAEEAFVDTLDVTLDLSGAITPGEGFLEKLGQERGVDRSGVSLARVVEVTVACILENAGRSLPPIEHLHLAVHGDWSFVPRSGVFRVGPSRRHP